MENPFDFQSLKHQTDVGVFKTNAIELEKVIQSQDKRWYVHQFCIVDKPNFIV